MAREFSRLQCGHFRSQTRIVSAIAKLIQPAAEGNISVLDCCCGEGAALAELKQQWGSPANVKTFGIELDKGRAESAERVLDEVLWSGIEESHPSACASMVYANFPYDEIRGAGRMEEELFNIVKDWPVRKKGVLVLVVPKQVLRADYSRLSHAIEMNYEVKCVFEYPEPERSEFGQSVLVGVRRDKEVQCSWSYNPAWARLEWPVLPLDAATPRWTLQPSANVQLRRVEVSEEVMQATVVKSPLRHSLLLEALLPEPPLQRPPLALRAGHTALLLAGGMETEINDPVHGKFMVKGSLKKTNEKVKSEEKCDSEGVPCAVVDFWRTKYALSVKTLLENGGIESFTSEPEEQLVEVEQEQGDEE